MGDKAIVSIVKVKRENIKESVKYVVDLIGGFKKYIRKNSKVLIKPNLVYPYPPPMVTSPEVIEAVVELVFEAGAKEVWIGDSSSYTGKSQYGLPRWTNEEIFEIHGINNIACKTGAKVINFDDTESVKVNIPNGIILKEVEIFKPVLDADVIVNLPALKMHFQTLVTLGIKNFHGVIPDYWKLQFHRDEISQKLVDINKVVKPGLTIIDGITAMQGLGPRTGTSVEMNILLASSDIVAVDAVASEVMGVKAHEVETTRLANQQGLGIGNLENINVIGEKIEKVMKILERPDVSIEGIFPGITVIKGGVCVHCYGRARIFLDSLYSSDMVNTANIKYVIIGVKPSIPDFNNKEGNILLVGDCAIDAAHSIRYSLKDRIYLMEGCPPLTSVHVLLNKIKEKHNKKKNGG
ncbi:MAG: DUF362 domain-containing protein [Actinobacteria bacterium]|nr:DUF362 domain-containing protein [Actinomycetota bacterium]